MKSTKFSLTWQQVVKAIILTFLGAMIPVITGWLEAGSFPTDWDTWRTALFTSFVPVLYLVYSWIQNSEGKLMKPEPKKDEPLEPIREP